MQQESIKIIGQSGQLSLGKEFAGRAALVELIEPGVWHIRLGSFVPDNERWAWGTAVQQQLHRAEAYIAEHPVKESTLDDIAALEAR
jgi:hypothetical protein